MSDELKDAISLASIGKPYRSYPGTGGIWAGRNEQFPDGDFRDWGLARATATILNAAVTGELAPRAGEWNEAIEAAAKIAENFQAEQRQKADEWRDAAQREESVAGREVSLETAVGFGKRAAAAKSIAESIRALSR
jgi:hypothetical protein